MAVLRANRLWTAALPPALTRPVVLPSPDPKEPEAGGLASATYVYTCPTGKRAIIRTLTTVLQNIPPSSEEPTVKYYIHDPAGWGWAFHYFWFVDHSKDIGVWILESNWSGQMVLNAGDKVRAVWACTAEGVTVGSGMLLDV